MGASAALVEVVARTVAEDMYAAERDDPKGNIAVAGRVFPSLLVAARVSLEEVRRLLGTEESIVDFAAAHRYSVSATVSVHLVLFVATSRRLFLVDNEEGRMLVAHPAWSTVVVDRHQVSVLPGVRDVGSKMLVSVRGPLADWLEELQRTRPIEPVGRLAAALTAR